jgi:pilus assembly protein Flp/PilA
MSPTLLTGIAGRARNERAATSVEYGLLITGIAAVVAAMVFTFGHTVKTALYDDTCNTIAAQTAQGTC